MNRMIGDFTMQDITGTLAGTGLFSLLFIPSGYVICYFLDLFNFRSRLQIVRLGFGFLVSCAITPVLYFAAYRLISEKFAFAILTAFVILFLFVAIKNKVFQGLADEIKGSKKIRMVLGISGAWIIVALISSIDIQIGNRLYFNITSYDYQTRVSVIDAISRTGVPPQNPSYFPGGPSKLTFLYYFWYVLCSLIDKIGGDVVSARTALFASVIWAGFATMGMVAIYLRLRNSRHTSDHWRVATIGIGLLAVSGLDVFGSAFYMAFPKYLYGYFIDGDIEHWNEQITAWAGTAMWTPHHLMSMLNCVMGWMLVANHENVDTLRKIGAGMLAGLAFASAFGLSSWVTLIFVMFWFFWILTRLLGGERITTIWVLFIPGIVAAVSIFPFVLDLIGSGGDEGTSSIQALALDVRWFRPALYFIIGTPSWLASTINLLLLPINYFLELGFFFLVGILWLWQTWKAPLEQTNLYRLEILLLGISVFLTSFTRSTLIANNDFGWRGWLPGQYILLIWGTDILSHFWEKNSISWKFLLAKSAKVGRIKYSILVLVALGILTTLQDIVLLRIWPILVDAKVVVLPDIIRSDEYLGTKNYEARALFAEIDKGYPLSAIVQFNPSAGLNRATGLYRTRGTVLSFHSLYGVPEGQYKPLGISLAKIFNQTYNDWRNLDASCKQYKINILIIADRDELWESIPLLAEFREPIYKGNHYTAFECGN